MRRLLACLLTCCGLTDAARASEGDDAWRLLPIHGGGFMQNVLFTADPSVLYTYADVAGPYRSDDGGMTWRALHGNLTTPMRMRQFGCVRSMSVDPRDPDSFVVCAGNSPAAPGGIAVSRDGGRTFRQTCPARFYGNGKRRMTGFLLTRNPRNPDELVSGGDRDGLLRSTDNGETWTSVGPKGHWFTDIRFDATVPNRVWACAPGYADLPSEADQVARKVWPLASPEWRRDRGLFRSDDGGTTWTRLDVAEIPSELAQVPGDPSVTGLFAEQFVRRSADGGVTWTDFHQGLPTLPSGVRTWDNYGCQRGRYYALTAGPDFLLVADTRGNCFRRAVGAATWTECPRASLKAADPVREPRLATLNHMPMTASLTVDPRDAAHWMLTDWYAVWETRDAGTNWISRVTGIQQLVAFQVASSPFDPGRIFYCAADSNLFVSDDGGRTFASRLKNSVNCVAWSRVTPGLALLTGGKFTCDLVRTRDGGLTFEQPARKGLPELVPDNTYRDPSRHGCFTVVCHPRADAFLVAVGGRTGRGQGGIYRSVDAGESWSWFGEGLPDGENLFQNCEWGVGRPQIAVSEDGSMVAFSQNGRQVFRRDSGAPAWEPVPFAMRAPDAVYHQDGRPQIVAVPGRPGHFLALSGDGVPALHLSADGGRSFRKMDGPSGIFLSAAFDWANPGLLVVAGRDEVYVSRDDGAHFAVLPGGKDLPTGEGGRISVDRGRLWCICSGSGTWTRQLPD